MLHISATSNQVRLTNLVLQDCMVKEGMLPPDGGAILVSSGHLIVKDCRFMSNSVSAGSGGAVAVRNGLALFENCEFIHNRAISGSAPPPRDTGWARLRMTPSHPALSQRRD